MLCDAFRHPAVLAREAVSLDHASGGRFELGIGWGSVPTELHTFGVGSTEPRDRVDRLGETLQVVRALWTGEPVDFDGRFHQLRGAQQRPTPLGRIPIVIGGAGPKTLRLVARARRLVEPLGRQGGPPRRAATEVGEARPSIQQMVTYAPDPATRDEVLGGADRRFGHLPGRVVGDSDAMRAHLHDLEARGIERAYVWFTDFADEPTSPASATRCSRPCSADEPARPRPGGPWDGPRTPSTCWGSILPDLESLLGQRLESARSRPTVADGIALHHATDAAFHADARFVSGSIALTRALQAAGVGRGPSRAVGHAGGSSCSTACWWTTPR